MKIGFIGLGNMGGPMAANLAKAGHEVTGFDTADVSIEGVTMAPTAADAAKGNKVVITMLPNGKILRAVAEEIHPAMDKGAVHLDCSTVDVDSARAVAEAAQAAGLSALDAPVSGGVGGATNGTLTFMVGGDEAGFNIAKELFDIMGQKAVHCGPSGNGQAAKICNNMILGITMLGVSEAFVLAERLGLDAQKLFDISSTASGQCWALTSYCPVPGPLPSSPANRDYQPGFAAGMMLKDLKLAQDAAHTSGAATPLGAEAAALYSMFCNSGGAELDFSAIVKYLRGS